MRLAFRAERRPPPLAKAERLSSALDCVRLSRAKGCEIGAKRVAGVLTATQSRVVEPVHATVVSFRNEGGGAMSTKVIVERSMVRVRRALSAWLMALAIGWATAAVAGPSEDLIDAATRGDVASAQALLAKGADVDAKTSDGVTALMAAALHGRLDMVQALLDKGAAVNARDYDGWTALLRASSKGQIDVAQALLDKGAQVNARTNDGVNALLSPPRKAASISCRRCSPRAPRSISKPATARPR